MKVEIGKRYRLMRPDGKNEIVTVESGGDDDGWVETDLGPVCRSKGDRKGVYVFGLQHDKIYMGLYLVEIAPPPVTNSHPILGDDPSAFSRLQERFKNWDFSTGTY